MKTRIIFCLGLAATSLAWADTSVNPSALGGVDAVLQFCGQINPAGASAYRSLKESLFGKQLDHALDAVERTAAYRQALTEVGGALAAAAPDWALKACIDIVPGPGGVERRKDDRHDGDHKD
jgi:hypothetical protein